MTSTAPTAHDAMPCPCGLGGSYADCCGRFHAGATAPTAAQLMRSRYSAFAVGEMRYLLDTWHPSTRPADLELDSEMRWLRLLVEETVGGGPFDHEGTVTFTAIGRTAEDGFEQHERSLFVREGGRWYYVDSA